MSKKKSSLDTYESINFFSTDILAMTRDCIFANKLVALSHRFKNRDLFDIWFFFQKGFPINDTVILEKTGKTLHLFLAQLKDAIPKHYRTKTILAELGDLVTEKQKHFIKEKLIQECLVHIDFTLRFLS